MKIFQVTLAVIQKKNKKIKKLIKTKTNPKHDSNGAGSARKNQFKKSKRSVPTRIVVVNLYLQSNLQYTLTVDIRLLNHPNKSLFRHQYPQNQKSYQRLPNPLKAKLTRQNLQLQALRIQLSYQLKLTRQVLNLH